MENDAPLIHKENFLKLLYEELTAIGDDFEVSPPQAYAQLVLRTLGYEFIEGQYSDGSKEYGIDYWDSSEESSTIFQFKSTDYTRGIDYSRKVVPDHLTDLPRIRKTLKSLDTGGITPNPSVTTFLDRLLHNVRRHVEKDKKVGEPYQILIHLAVLASSFTEQADQEFQLEKEDTLLHLKEGTLKLSYVPILIDDLINEKWRRINTEWKDCNGKKRDYVELTVCDDKFIDEAKSIVFFTQAINLVEAYQNFGYQIFEPNVRCEIPKSRVNDQIRASIQSSRGRKEFRHLNNGITIICANFRKPNRSGQKIKILEPGIINGLQTVKSMYDAYKGLDPAGKLEFDKDCSVLVRLHFRNAVADYRQLVKSTNNQNPMQPRNLRSNDPEQIAFERMFSDLGWFYERKQGAWAAFKSNPHLWRTLAHKKLSDFQLSGRRYRTVDNEELGQCWLAFLGYSNEAVHNKKDIFEKDDLYEFIFLCRPLMHGGDKGFELNLKEPAVHQAPPPELMLVSWFLRECVRKLVSAAQKNRDEACKRLKIEHKTKEEQDAGLAKDKLYLGNVILRAFSLLFPEFVGFVLFRAFKDQVYSIGKTLLQNQSIELLYNDMDFEGLAEKVETKQYEKDDFLIVMWNLFIHCANNLVQSPWLESWKQAKSRTRFNYSIDTRTRLRQELEETDRFLSKDQITREWASGLNQSKGVFTFAREKLTAKGKEG